MKKLLIDATIGVGVFVGIAALGYHVDVLLAAAGMDLAKTVLNNLIGSAVAGFLTYVLLRERRHKEALLEGRLQVLGQAFDHIRNALQIVAYSCNDEQAKAAVFRLTSAMQATSELTPALVPDLSKIAFRSAPTESLAKSRAAGEAR